MIICSLYVVGLFEFDLFVVQPEIANIEKTINQITVRPSVSFQHNQNQQGILKPFVYTTYLGCPYPKN